MTRRFPRTLRRNKRSHPCDLVPLESRILFSLAFSGAYGFGASASGGRGGSIYHVTNLNDSGAGSFRDAVGASNRIIVFDVGGYVNLLSAVSVKSNLTILGQTAPGEGFGVMGREVSFNAASNDIVRYLRFRQGDLDPDSSKSGINLLNASNMIFDHVSIEFAQWNNIDAVGATNITVQNSIIADPIGQQFNAHTETLGGNFTWYNDIFANAHNRSPLAKINTQFVNNVVYNYQAGFTAGNTTSHFSFDVINNYFITGPSTSSANDDYYQVSSSDKAYAAGNILDSNRDGTLNGSADNTVDGAVVLTSPWSPALPTTSAAAAYAYDIANAGASLHRDDVDAQVIADVTSLGTSGRMWTHQTSTGLANSGYGTLDGGPQLTDSDGDGMPDDFERAYGLNPASASDASGDFDSTGYTNLEKYANGIADDTYAFLPAGWQVTSVGSPAIAPWIASDNLEGNFTLRASAPVAGATGDTLTFASQAFSGDGTLTTQVTSQSADTGTTGIMFRDSASPTAAFASMNTDLKNHVFFTWRSSNGGSSTYAFVYQSAPVYLRLVRAGNAFSGFYSTDGITWTQVGTTRTLNISANALAGLTQAGSSTATLSTATFSHFALVSAVGNAVTDIGTPALAGETSNDSSAGTWILRASSGASTTAGENMRLVSQTVTGSAAIQAQLVSKDANVGGAGIIFRNSMDAASAFAIVEADDKGHIFFRYRTSDGGAPSYYVAYSAAPVWLRLVRTGNSFTAWYTSDPAIWFQIGSARTLNIATTAIAGIEASGNSATALGSAMFANFIVVPAPRWLTLALGGPNPRPNAIDSLIVTFSAPVTLADGALTLTSTTPDLTVLFQIDLTITNPSGDGQTFLLSFNSATLTGGTFDLEPDPTKITDAYGQLLTSDS